MIEFASPAFLYALPAAAIPWIIDLLNRRRFRRVRWAAMDYLVQAAQQRRRRVRLKHLLLLLARTLAVILIVLLFARPGASRALAGLGASGGSIVVALDDSASMAQRAGAGSVFDRARAYVLSLAERAAAGGAKLSVYLPGRAEPLRLSDPAQMRQALEPMRPSAAAFGMDWLAGLGAPSAGSGQAAPRYYVITDLRAADWGAESAAPAARRALDALQTFGPVVIVDVGAEPGPNAGITAVERAGRFAYAAESAALRLVIQNDGPVAVPAGPIGVSADGGELPAVAAPSVASGGKASMPFDVYLGASGGHTVRAALPGGDDLPPDDVRYYALDAAARVPVLIVEGRPGAALYLKTALQPVSGAQPGLQPQVVSAGADLPSDLAPYAAVFLCDVTSPAPWRDALVRYVRAGGRLVAFLGAEADADAYNGTLFADGGLPVCRIAGVARPGKDSPVRISGIDFAAPLLLPFADWQALFAAPAFWQYFQLQPLGNARAPLRFSDAPASAALLVADVGQGMTALFPFGAGDAWTDWPRSDLGRAAYLSLMQWLVEFGAPAGPSLDLDAGAAIHYPVDTDLYRSEATLVPPDAQGGAVTLRAAPLQGSGPQQGSGLYFTSGPLREAGIYALRMERSDGTRRTVYFAVNVPPAERLLARARAEVVRAAATAPGRLDVVRYEGAASQAPAVAAPLWRAAAALALVVLAVEGLMAYLFGNPPGVRR
jgi:hypothetical protein